MNKYIDKTLKLTEHFSLSEMCSTSVQTADHNFPTQAVITNLRRLCGWLEALRAYPQPLPKGGESGLQGGLGESSSKVNSIENTNPRSGNALLPLGKATGGRATLGMGVGGGLPIYINSGYRSVAVNRAVGGVATSNHLTGCAADIRCSGLEQALRYAAYLLDISKERGENFDELIIEHRVKTGNYWVHFAVRPNNNRRKVKIASL